MSERARVSSLHRSCFPRPPEWTLGKNGAASEERAPCPREGRGVSVGEEEVAGAGVAVSVAGAGADEDVVAAGVGGAASERVDGSGGESKQRWGVGVGRPIQVVKARAGPRVHGGSSAA